jgi:hypothetical protein
MEKCSKVIDIYMLLCLFIGIVTTGCKDDVSKKCYKVQMITRYCSDRNTVLVYIDKPNEFATTIEGASEKKARYTAAITDFPEELIVNDTTVFIHFKYDIERERSYWKDKICTSLFSPVKILVFESLSTERCE